MAAEIIDPHVLQRGHPLREKAESDDRLGYMEKVMTEDLLRDKPMPGIEGENEVIFNLHHNIIAEPLRGVLSKDFVEAVGKIIALSNITKDEVSELEYHFDILAIKEINYSKRSEYTPTKSRALEIMRSYFYAQVRRSRNGWEREMEVTERKTLRSEVPMAMKKKKPSFFGRMFGGG